MFWVILVIVIILVGIGGGTLPSTGNNGTVPTGLGCDYCKQLPAYWSGLSFFQKIWMSVWYAFKRMDCYLKGCK